VKQAENVLREKHIKSLCMDAVKQRPLDTKITLVELSELQQQIVDDSMYYA
jgi:hypothetical protein